MELNQLPGVRVKVTYKIQIPNGASNKDYLKQLPVLGKDPFGSWYSEATFR